MQIYDKRLDEIKPYENNPRHNDNAVDAVANSIREFGFKVPLVVDSEGVIVAGHTRYKAAQKLGLQTVPCLVADDLNKEQINAFRLADNKVGELATWDLDKLEAELASISDIDMSVYAFDMDEEVTQTIRGSEEVSLEDFEDDKFSCTCPQCGFKFNPKEN
jgi:site-specific DNA-methyltransferase (adenine-specific)